MFDVITIGTATQDVIIGANKLPTITTSDKKAIYQEYLAIGSKIDAQYVIFDIGGGATNSATTFANLGFKTACLCNIGDDAIAKDILTSLKKYKIDTSLVVVDHHSPSGYSVIINLPDGRRTILVFRGASKDLEEHEINFSRLKTKWFYLSSLGGNFKLLKSLISFASENQIKIAFNPGNSEIALGLKKLKPLLAKVDVLSMNTEEANSLLKTAIRPNKKNFPDLSSLTKGISIVTDSGNGAYLNDGHNNKYFIPALKVKRINTTGAGDAFSSGFVAGLMKKNNPLYAFQIGLLNSQSVVQHIGAKKGILKKFPTKLPPIYKINS